MEELMVSVFEWGDKVTLGHATVFLLLLLIVGAVLTFKRSANPPDEDDEHCNL